MKTIYNISLIILLIGIILLTIYITKITMLNSSEKEIYKESNKEYVKGLRRKINAPDIYDLRPNETFRKMFNEPAIIQKYQDFDVNEESNKLYIK
jgi:hypothetical protein